MSFNSAQLLADFKFKFRFLSFCKRKKECYYQESECSVYALMNYLPLVQCSVQFGITLTREYTHAHVHFIGLELAKIGA